MRGSLLPFSVVSAGISICSYALFFLGDRVKWDGIIISTVSFFMCSVFPQYVLKFPLCLKRNCEHSYYYSAKNSSNSFCGFTVYIAPGAAVVWNTVYVLVKIFLILPSKQFPFPLHNNVFQCCTAVVKVDHT